MSEKASERQLSRIFQGPFCFKEDDVPCSKNAVLRHDILQSKCGDILPTDKNIDVPAECRYTRILRSVLFN
jgi:hypothetical protein